MQDFTLYYLFLKYNIIHYYFDKILLFIKSGCYKRKSNQKSTRNGSQEVKLYSGAQTSEQEDPSAPRQEIRPANQTLMGGKIGLEC
jgi:hypothetical protein